MKDQVFTLEVDGIDKEITVKDGKIAKIVILNPEKVQADVGEGSNDPLPEKGEDTAKNIGTESKEKKKKALHL